MVHLDTLKDRGHDMPDPRYGLWVKAEVLVPVASPQALTDPGVAAARAQIAAATGKEHPYVNGARISIDAEFPSTVHLADPETVPSPDAHHRAAVAQLDLDSGFTLANISTRKFLRTVSA
jgi:hypothetical protein